MHHDVIIIGGSFAGLSAAMYLARGRRSVCVVDTGLPRNRFAEHSHGFFGHDGGEPRTMLANARSQVAAYPTTTFIEGEAIGAQRDGDAFAVRLATDEVLHGSRLVLAFGISDELPDIPGLPERWGKSVLHCPYCHGFEFSGRRLGVLHLTPMSIHQAMLVAEWGPTTLFLNGGPDPDDATLAELRRHRVAIEPRSVTSLGGRGDALSAVELLGGKTVELDALYIGPRNRLNNDIGQQLGCEVAETPLGTMLRTDDTRSTTVPGVFAAGDIARGAHSVTWASADGVTAGLAAHRSLVFSGEAG